MRRHSFKILRSALSATTRTYGWTIIPRERTLASHNAFLEYLPLNLSPAADMRPFYRIGQGYLGSQHNVPATAPTVTDEVKCIGCHISISAAHSGTGEIPGTGRCGVCHSTTNFLATAHGNQNGIPGKFFDQLSNGVGRATATLSLMEGPVKLRRSNKKTAVNRNQTYRRMQRLPQLCPRVSSP